MGVTDLRRWRVAVGSRTSWRLGDGSERFSGGDLHRDAWFGVHAAGWLLAIGVVVGEAPAVIQKRRAS
jgi:hypothetical protein